MPVDLSPLDIMLVSYVYWFCVCYVKYMKQYIMSH